MSFPRMSLHIGDYKKDTGHLRAAGHGAYLLLMMHYWATGPLPDDDKQLSAIACMTDKEWSYWGPIIKKLFKGDWSFHKRIEAELADAKAKYEKRVAAGREGGKAKAKGKQKPSNATANDLAKPYQPITDNPHSEEPNGSSGASAPPTVPVYADAKHELWTEGPAILAGLGIAKSQQRTLIGRWMRDAGDDAGALLAILRRAAREKPQDPVPWIARAIPPRGRSPPSRGGGGFAALIADRYGDQTDEPDRTVPESPTLDLTPAGRG